MASLSKEDLLGFDLNDTCSRVNFELDLPAFA